MILLFPRIDPYCKYSHSHRKTNPRRDNETHEDISHKLDFVRDRSVSVTDLCEESRSGVNHSMATH